MPWNGGSRPLTTSMCSIAFPLTAAQKAILERFEKPATPINLDVHAVDLSAKVAPEALALWQKQPRDAVLPLVVVRHAEAEDGDPPIYSALDEKAAGRSGRFRARCASKSSSCWRRARRRYGCCSKSGERKADDEAAGLLKRELARLEKDIKLLRTARTRGRRC